MGPVRAEIFGETERLALQCVQPFALGEEARSAGVEWSTPADQELLTDGAWALNTVWNIDKHRRLPELAWGRDDLFWWQGADQDSVKKWRALVPSGSSLEDNQLILELGAAQGNGRPDVNLMQEISLLLVDDPSPFKRAVGERLEQLHQSLSGWVLPRIFVTADGNPPPIMISFRPPRSNPCALNYAALCPLIMHERILPYEVPDLLFCANFWHLSGDAMATQIGGDARLGPCRASVARAVADGGCRAGSGLALRPAGVVMAEETAVR